MWISPLDLPLLERSVQRTGPHVPILFAASMLGSGVALTLILMRKRDWEHCITIGGFLRPSSPLVRALFLHLFLVSSNQAKLDNLALHWIVLNRFWVYRPSEGLY